MSNALLRRHWQLDYRPAQLAELTALLRAVSEKASSSLETYFGIPGFDQLPEPVRTAVVELSRAHDDFAAALRQAAEASPAEREYFGPPLIALAGRLATAEGRAVAELTGLRARFLAALTYV